MANTTYREIKDSLTQLYLDDPRPWLVGPDYFGIFDFSGGKDSPDPSGLASLIFAAVLSVPAEQRGKPVTVLCTDTGLEIPAIAEVSVRAMEEGTLARMHKFPQQKHLIGCSLRCVSQKASPPQSREVPWP